MPFGDILHGMAGATGLSNFLQAFGRISLSFRHPDRSKPIPLSFRAKSSFCFCFAHSCLFSILSGFTYFRPYFWPYMIWSGSLNVCQSPPGPHSFGNFCFNEVKFGNPFHECDTCLFEETLQQSSIMFKLHDPVPSIYFSRKVFLPSARSVEHEVQCDDDRWSKSPWIDQKSARASASSVHSIG